MARSITATGVRQAAPGIAVGARRWTAGGREILQAITRFAFAALILVAAAVFGVPVINTLSGGGFLTVRPALPAVLVLIALITFVLLLLLTGSAVIPLQALVCNVLSLTAAFGAMVWIFQDGHLGALGTTPWPGRGCSGWG